MTVYPEGLPTIEPHNDDPHARWQALTPRQQLHEILTLFPPSDWLTEPALSLLASYRTQPLFWAQIGIAWTERAPRLPLRLLEEAIDSWREALGNPPARRGRGRPRALPVSDPLAAALGEAADRPALLTTASGDPKFAISNLMVLLEADAPDDWNFWWDDVRGQPMVGALPVDDAFVTQVCYWLGTEKRMVVTNKKTVGDVVVDLCRKHPRDLLQEWLAGLPEWDTERRLETWLRTYAGTPESDYSRDVARLLPVSMVARALAPGCQYRYVVLLEGKENTGKSRLVRTLGGEDWTYEAVIGLDGKEAYIALQGAWVVELPELNAMTRTEENHFKALVSQVKDSWVPKFANYRIERQRRAIFVGTLNPDGSKEYLRGKTGNTRYLPVETGAIDIEGLAAVRAQLFAEALAFYRQCPRTWWILSTEAKATLAALREERRVSSAYEDDLAAWLEREGRTVITWPEIAQDYLQLERWAWSDKSRQMQITDALHALGWIKKRGRAPGSRTLRREWHHPDALGRDTLPDITEAMGDLPPLP